ncbi:MAG: ABC transporter permease [Phycisphaerales bacterium]
MGKVWQVLIREYKSTVLTKAFIFGAFVFPILFYGLMIILPQIIKSEAPRMEGRVAIMDATEYAAPWIEEEFDAEAIETKKAELAKLQESEEAQAELRKQMEGLAGPMGSVAVAFAGGAGGALLDQPTPQIEIDLLEPVTDQNELEELRARMTEQINRGELLAYIELNRNALQPLESKAIRLQTPSGMHSRNVSGLEQGIRQGVVRARIHSSGLTELDVSQIQLANVPPRINRSMVTDEGEAKDASELAEFMPIIFMMLLWISTFTGGQYLLMSTIEEKQSRVMEVLLSAVSSMQLMTGKIFGQGAVGLTMLAVYMALGWSALDKFELDHLIGIDQILAFVPFFFMAYLFVGCMMAAVGSAVSDPREASAMMTPLMMVMLVPFVVMIPIMEAPNGSLATTLSFIPPFTPFIMAMRLGSNQEVEMWQVVATNVIGFAAVFAGVWATAKIFRIGVLMYGKPPNLKTLLKWLRQA